MLTRGMCELSVSKTYQHGHYILDSMTVIMGMTAFLLSIVATASEILMVWNVSGVKLSDYSGLKLLRENDFRYILTESTCNKAVNTER